MKNFIRYIKLYLHYASKHIKVMLEYRVDFLIGMFSTIIQQGISIILLKIIFSNIQVLKGWTFYEILFIFEIAFLGRSIHHIFFDNLWTLGWQYIRSGNFERLLLRPVNPLFQVISERFQQDGFGQFIIGIIILLYSTSHIGINWGITEIGMLILFIISSGMIFVAINLFFITFSFWMVDSLPIVVSVFGLSEFARYPVTIYHKSITLVITWIIPYGFTAFYPANYFLDGHGVSILAIVTPLFAITSFVVAYKFWNFGVKHYESTGH